MSKIFDCLVHYDGNIVYAESYGIYGTKYALYRTKFDKYQFKIVNTEEVTHCDREVVFSTKEEELVPMYKYLGLLKRVEDLEARQ